MEMGEAGNKLWLRRTVLQYYNKNLNSDREAVLVAAFNLSKHMPD